MTAKGHATGAIHKRMPARLVQAIALHYHHGWVAERMGITRD